MTLLHDAINMGVSSERGFEAESTESVPKHLEYIIPGGDVNFLLVKLGRIQTDHSYLPQLEQRLEVADLAQEQWPSLGSVLRGSYLMVFGPLRQ